MPALVLGEGVINAIAAGVERGLPPSTAARLAGISDRNVRGWLQALADDQWPDGTALEPTTRTLLAAFAERIADARAKCEARMLESVVSAAETTNEKTGLREWRAGAWLLEHAPAYKKEYAEYREMKVEHGGQVDHWHRRVREMTDAELIDVLPAELRELVPSVQLGST